ncbi:MAG: GlxA family transcriptional regulator [Gammaproteobacteria bacterium]|nr:GlxA family transcriptional regulator [Gammaproteobacteria bacterium]
MNAPETTRYGFLLVPEYSMMAFTAAIDQLRMANRLSGKPLYEWVVMTEDGAPVPASSGLSVQAVAMLDAGALEAVFVCGGTRIETRTRPAIAAWLKAQSSRRVALGAICTGTFVLAEAGLLRGYRCTIHWENMPGLRERFPELVISPDLFELDRDRYTCAGGSAAVDMMVSLIAGKHGWDLAHQVAEEFLVERVRGRNDRQRLPLRLQLGTSQPKLAEAVAYMAANLEEPIGLDEIASHINLSRRQLERLFQKHLRCVPTRYYMRLRLEHARRLLLQTSLPVVEVAYASGFASTPHFSKCYREHFDILPRADRRRQGQLEIEAG